MRVVKLSWWVYHLRNIEAQKSQGQKKMVKMKGVCHMLKLSMNKWNHRGSGADNNKGIGS